MAKTKIKDHFVYYSNCDEVIITTRKQEKKAIKEYFTEGGRDIGDFEREECPDAGLLVTSGVSCW